MLPLFIGGMGFLAAKLHPGPLLLIAQLLWAATGFFIPMISSTGDMRYAVRRWREVGWFRPLMSRQDFECFYIPAWIRLGVVVVSAVVSLLILDRIGVRP